jgi:hypothetical protein
MTEISGAPGANAIDDPAGRIPNKKAALGAPLFKLKFRNET